MKGVLDHQGTTLQSGHYVSYIRTKDDNWVYCNDNISRSSLQSANNRDNYILLLEKIDPVSFEKPNRSNITELLDVYNW